MCRVPDATVESCSWRWWFVMDMLVLVFQRVMNMFVLVPLAQVQPDTAISVPAANNRGVMASPSITASTAPRNGATEK